MRDPSTSVKRWRLYPPITTEIRNRLITYDPVMAQILANRGQDTPEKAQKFLHGGDDTLHNPFLMAGMAPAVERIRRAIKLGEPIAVYGDFDADGVTSTAVLTQALEALGGHVQPYIPNRVDEGYGLNQDALRTLHEQGVRLVITVDCGIRSVEEVAFGKRLGLDLIVTDHHSVGEELPPALAVIDPKIDAQQRRNGNRESGYPEDMLAGVGVAFKLADALFRAEAQQSARTLSFKLEDLLDLVALGTVADLAPLDRLENRELVRRGLEVLNRAQRPGIYELAQVAKVEPGKISTMSIGYMLGPRINAAGRLSDAMIAYNLLTMDLPHAGRLAQELQELNVLRQELTLEAVEVARARVQETDLDAVRLIFADDLESKQGIIGLVAGRLCEEFYLPAVVIEKGDEESRGSCRSIPEFNITEALDQCADLLIRHGGHAQAAGFTIPNANIPALRERLLGFAESTLRGQDLRPSLDIDAEVAFEALTRDLADELRRLEPTGARNEQPLLMTRQVRVADYKQVGADGRHLRLKLQAGGRAIDGIGFKLGEWADRMPALIDVAYHLEVNVWNGTEKLQLNIQDLRPTGQGD